ncbi:MAG: ASKHA domain-containing protein [Clostridiales bacterium]|nr:ASKHA domain-containing protein [Clostridiales bacterium]
MRFDIPEISSDKVLAAVGCREDSPVYAALNAECAQVLKRAQSLCTPQAKVVFEDKYCYVLMSVGGEISNCSTDFFKAGEGTKGLLANAAGDEYLFALDKAVSEYIKKECAKRSLGVSEREDSPDMERLLEKCALDGVCLTGGGMLSPAKSMGYILTLSDNAEIFKGQHDCSKCPCTDCPRRSAPFKDAQILADYSAPIPEGTNAICIDIGTTTLVFSLIQNGKATKTISEVNPQRRFGADVLSRIEAAQRGRGAELKQAIEYRLIKGVRELVQPETEKIVISANTTMVYLMMGYDPAELGKYPFTVSKGETIHMDFDKMTLSDIKLPVTVIGAASAFIGGDIVSGIYMTGMDENEKTALLADLGTNGEMALRVGDTIFTASAAAGPAFEGGAISCGCASVAGAVCSVDRKSGAVRTIGGKNPIGICGSGIAELIAYMLDKGIIDKTGRLADRYFEKGYPFAPGLFFTQKDIRAVQTAKAAVCAGIETLVKRSGAKDIDTVYLAGGFGQALDASAAAKIGLIPEYLKDKLRPVGNSSLGGAAKYAGTGDDGAIDRICTMTTEIILGNDNYFTQKYVENMNF